MSTTPLATLRLPLTSSQLAQIVRTGAANQGLPVSDWAPTADGGIENGVVDTSTGALAELGAQVVADGIAGGFLGLATGPWLEFLARRFYLNAKNLATKTVQMLTLTCAPKAGPHVIQPRQLWAIGGGGNRYQNIDGGTLQPGATLRLRFEAEAAGAAYNDAPGTIILLSTSLTGVTVANARVMSPNPAALMTGGLSRGLIVPVDAPSVALDRFRLRVVASGQAKPATAQFVVSTDDGRTWSAPFTAAGSPVASLFGSTSIGTLPIAPGVTAFAKNAPLTSPSFVEGDVFFWANTPIVQQGSDDETGPRLAGRCRSRWLTLSDVASPGTVELWAKNASPEVARVLVLSDPNRANSMLVYVGSSSGVVGPTTLVAIQQYISDRVDKDSGESANVLSVALREFAPTGSVQVPRQTLADVQTLAESLWTKYLASVEIGGKVILAELQQAIMDAGAIDYSSLSIGGSPNVVLGRDEVAVPRPGTTLASQLSWEAI
jgi:hypothetical protein